MCTITDHHLIFFFVYNCIIHQNELKRTKKIYGGIIILIWKTIDAAKENRR